MLDIQTLSWPSVSELLIILGNPPPVSTVNHTVGELEFMIPELGDDHGQTSRHVNERVLTLANLGMVTSGNDDQRLSESGSVALM